MTFTAAGIVDSNVVNWKGSAAPAMTGDAYAKVSGLTFTTANQVDARVLTNSDKTGYTASTVSDKTGYSLTQTFPTNFSALSISATTGLVDITQTAADKVWGTAARTLTAGTNIALAKGSGITGFNDLSASDIGTAVWTTPATRTLSAGTNIILAKGVGITGLNDITAANIWDTDISAYSGAKAGTYVKGIYDKLPATTIGTSTYAGGAVASVTNPVTVGTNNDKTGYTVSTVSDKTGYSLTQAFPANFEHLSITDTTGLVDITQAAADKAWGTTTRELTSGGFAGLTSADIDLIWDAVLADHLDTGTMGKALSSAGLAGDPLSASVPGSYAPGTAGYILGANLNATVSSRSTLTAQNVWEYVNRILTAGTNIVLVKDIGVTGFNDITASSVWASVSRTLTGTQAFNLTGNIIGNVTGSVGSLVSGLITVDQIVDGVWDEATSAHTSSGSTGKRLAEFPTPYDVGP